MKPICNREMLLIYMVFVHLKTKKFKALMEDPECFLGVTLDSVQKKIEK